MELSLIMLIVAFFVVAFLIIKFIKKVVFAVISVILLFLLVVGGLVGLVYMDLNQLMEGKDYDLQVIYSQDDKYALGVNLPIENMNVDIEKVNAISKEDLQSLDVKEIKKDDNKFAIIIKEETFKELLGDDGFDLKSVEGLDLSLVEDLDLTLSSDEVLTIINSEDDITALIDVFFAKNGIDKLKDLIADKAGSEAGMLLEFANEEMIKSLVSGFFSEQLEEQLDELGIDLREALFMLSLSQAGESNEGILTLYEAFDSKELEIYPNRLSFTALRILPGSYVKEKLTSFMEE